MNKKEVNNTINLIEEKVQEKEKNQDDELLKEKLPEQPTKNEHTNIIENGKDKNIEVTEVVAVKALIVTGKVQQKGSKFDDSQKVEEYDDG